ncbi:MAG: endonuclease V, partial [Vicinamibacterales bacterium]
FGLASHIGVLYDRATIGVTRNNLYGHVNQPPAGRFNRSPIINPRTNILTGYAVSLGDKCQPIYVSPGHRLTAEDAVTVLCRIAGPDTCFPWPLRRAHAIANATAKRYWHTHKPN